MPDVSELIRKAATTVTNSSFTKNNPKKRNLTEAQSKYKDEFIGLMRPKGDALKHPAADTLLEYARSGCPVDCGRDWTMEELEAAIRRGPLASMKDPKAAQSCRDEALQKVKEGHCRLVA